MSSTKKGPMKTVAEQSPGSGLEKTASSTTSSPKPRITVTLSSTTNSHHCSRTLSFKSIVSSHGRGTSRTRNGCSRTVRLSAQDNCVESDGLKVASQPNYQGGGAQQQVLRRCNVAMSLRRKKRVIQMLGVVVAEFFICWTPIYVMNTWYLFYPAQLYSLIGPLGVTSIQLLAYFSSCVNPITYCFMNQGFRMAFFRVFGCHCDGRQQSNSQRNDSLRLNRLTSVYSGNYNSPDATTTFQNSYKHTICTNI